MFAVAVAEEVVAGSVGREVEKLDWGGCRRRCL